MAFNIEELSETLKYNYSDMSDNRALTNELMVSDILVELGYNKKRDRAVRRLFEQDFDWVIEGTTGIDLIVKTLVISAGFSDEVISETFELAKQRGAEVLLITNGEVTRVYKLKTNRSEYKLLKIIIDFRGKELHYYAPYRLGDL